MRTLGIVAGIDREAAALGAPPADSSVRLAVSGLGREAATATAEKLLDGGAEALLSIGLAGGLRPDLRTGDVVVAASVLWTGSPPHDTNPAWREALAGKLGALEAPLLTVGRAAATAAEKHRLHQACGGAAVDMEAYGVAEAAARAGVPFLAVKIVADDCRTALPLAVLSAGGGWDGRALLIGVLKRPGDAGPAARLAWDGWRALRRLGRVAAAAGPRWSL